MRFTKMQGIGNDYIYVDCSRDQVKNPEELSREISDRHFGVGSDGLVLILPGDGDCDFEMRMFNADGSEGEMCGNATRCIGKYVYERGLTDRNPVRLKTRGGMKILELRIGKNGKVDSVRVDMGVPRFRPDLVPTTLLPNGEAGGEAAVVNAPMDVNGECMEVTCINTGNPHCVIFVPDPDSWDVAGWGRKIENDPRFPNKANIEFARVMAPGVIRMRVWERGSGETLACGTGACATLVAAVITGRTGRRAELRLNGGSLDIEWDEKTGHVFMTGPAAFVCDGEWPEEA